MNAPEKVARQRLRVLDPAEQLGNTAEACRRLSMDRTSFYEWRRRFQLEGPAGLKDLPPIHKSHPQATPVKVSERILAPTFDHPTYGCNRIEALLILEGKRVSAITIQKILNDYSLGTRYDRWLALEPRRAETTIELSAEQVAFAEKLNPAFRERQARLIAMSGQAVRRQPEGPSAKSILTP